MILVTFSGSVNQRNFRIFDELFSSKVKNNGNDCTAKATFFVSHAFTNYSAVQELHRRGHEIASYSITSEQNPEYWSTLTSFEYSQEFEGSAAIIEKFANISYGEITGMRVPHGRVGGNAQFRMMNETVFTYDSSISAVRGRLPLWPYSLQYRMPHKCLGLDQKCPSRSFEVMEMVLNELDRRDDPEHDERLTGCYYVDQCANVVEPDQFRRFLDHNLAHHYNTNRAPFGLHFTAAYFETRKSFLYEFKRWIKEKAQSGKYFFVTNKQAIDWMTNPVPISEIVDYPEWRTTCQVEGLPYCSIPNPCPFNLPRYFPYEEAVYLNTCADCPQQYPWLGYQEFGDYYEIPE